MKICLINVPNTYELVGNDPVIIKDQQGIYPPLGILYIAAWLRDTGRYEVSVIDCQAEDLSHSECAERVEQLKPDVVGITAMTFTLVDCRLVIDEIRKRWDCDIVVGGPHTAIFPMETFKGLRANYVIVGEGEITLDTLLQDIATRKVHRHSPESQRVYRQVKFIDDLNLLPFPAREMTKIDKYYSVLAHDTPTTTAFSSRGCPFSCKYCDRPAVGPNKADSGIPNEFKINGPGFRAMNAKRVVDEMEACQRLGIKETFFYDDTFSVSMKRVMEISDEIIRRKIKMRWDIRTRVNVVNEELIKKMALAGCDRIHFGVESGNPRVVKVMNKGTSIEQVEKAFDMCKRHGIKTLAYFMLGNPTETFEDVKDTLALSHRIKPDFMQMTILSPFPATQYYVEMRRDGAFGGRDPWKDYAMEINDDFRPPLWAQPDGIYTRQELEQQLRWFYGKFYLTPEFVWERIKEVRNMGQFKRYASAGLSLLKMTMLPEKKLKDSWGLRNKTGIAASKAPEAAVELK